VSALGKPTGDDGEPMKPLDFSAMRVRVDPREEWRQIYREVWRIQRDYFYDPNLHGVDVEKLTADFEPYLDGIVSRADLTYLLADMLGEITAQHIYIGGGERPQPQRVPGGLLGADYTIDKGRYRFAKIYKGENWNPDLRAPLTEPAVDVREGDYLLAVNGSPLTDKDEIFRLFEHTAGKAVRLSVGSDPGGKGAREVTVVPIADEESLRLRAWMEHNRAEVDRLSDGRLAYVYLPDTAVGGFTNFNRYYFAQVDRDGAVIDERFNGGGWVADYIVDWLNRPLLMMAMTREGEDFRLPFALYGPKVMLINELAGSGGDALPWMFRRLGIGPLVGTRTWGGLIGIGGYPSLIDGGFVTAPRWALYSPDGVFDVENKGVAPDHEVELDPYLWRQGRDPQLEKAVDLALRALRENPPKKITRPPYPDYHRSSAVRQ
jgi:tricorn protease